MGFDDEDRPRPRSWETTLQRQAEASFWANTQPAVYDGVRTCEPPAHPLAEVDLPRPTPPEPASTSVERYALTVSLKSSDGLSLPDVELIATDTLGDETRFVSNEVGVAKTLVQLDDVYSIRFAKTPISLPPPPVWSKEGGWGLRVSRDGGTFLLDADTTRDVVVVRPAVTEIVLDGYAQGACVMRWGGMRPRVDGTVATARAALRLALWLGRGKTMVVAGHADPLGQDSDNEALTTERAKSVQLFAAGRIDEWADHAVVHANELDVACALVECNKILGLGVAGLEDKSKLATALDAVRVHAGLAAHEGKPNADDWRAFAELYADDLAALLFVDRAGLAELQSTISWTSEPTLALGERFPLPQSELTDLAGPLAVALRRCSLLVFGPDDTAQSAVDADGHELYDGTYRRTVVRVPGEVLVDIAVDTMARTPISRARAWLNISNLGAHEHTAGEDGHIRFLTLEGDRVEVISAFDADGRGTMVSAGKEET
jgi:hypothetical protein